MRGTVVTVTSGKGGVGKTTTALNLAAALGGDGFSVTLVDADLGMANIGTMLDVRADLTLHDVLAGRADVESAVVSTRESMDIVPGGRNLGQYAEADAGRLPGVLDTLAERYGYVVVDTGAGLGYADVVPLEAADEVLLVTTPLDAAVIDTTKLAEFSGRVDARVRGVVVTRADEDTDPTAIAAGIGTELLGVVPEDPNVPESTAAGNTLRQHAPDSPAGVAYGQLAQVVSGQSTGPVRGVGESRGQTKPDTASRSTDRNTTGTTAPPSDVDTPSPGEDTSKTDGEKRDTGSDREPDNRILSFVRNLF